MQAWGWQGKARGWQVGLGLIGWLVAAPQAAHATTMGLGEATAAPGQSQVALPLSVAITNGQLITMLVWEVTYDPAVVDWEDLVLQPAVAALGKQVQAYEVSPGLVRLVVYGLDRQAFVSGALAECRLRVLPHAAAGSTVIGLSDASAANGNGGELPLGTADGRIWIETEDAPEPADTTPPVLALTSPADGAEFLVGAAVTVAGTATDNKAVAAVTVNGASVTPASDGAFSGAVSGLAAGPHTITVVATDDSGNASTLTRAIVIEAPEPPPSGAQVVPAGLMTSRSSQWSERGTDLTYWSANVWVEQRVDFGAGGPWALGLSAINQNNGLLGLPGGYAFNLAVTIDGAAKGTLKVPGSTTTYQNGVLNITAPAGVHTVRFTWTNDYWLAALFDANIRIKEASFAPGVVAPPAPPANTPSVVILSPAHGSTVSGSTQMLKFDVTNHPLGITKGHLHIQVDNGSTWHVYSETPLYLKNLSRGQHRVQILMVDGHHKAISTTPVTSTFTVQ